MAAPGFSLQGNFPEHEDLSSGAPTTRTDPNWGRPNSTNQDPWSQMPNNPAHTSPPASSSVSAGWQQPAFPQLNINQVGINQRTTRASTASTLDPSGIESRTGIGPSLDGLFGEPSGPNGAVANLVLRSGQGFVRDKMGGLMSWLGAYNLKYYYTVDNHYVLMKLKRILLPTLYTNWTRTGGSDTTNLDSDHAATSCAEPKPPMQDENAPDLYIPTMAFVTFILLMGFAQGVSGEFQPEVLTSTASSTLVWLCLELLLVKFGFYALDKAAPPLLDLLSYAGYKYVGLIIDVLAGQLLGVWAFYFTTFLTGCMTAVFIIRTLKGSGALGSQAGELYTKPLLLAGGLQLVIGFFLVRPAAKSAATSLSLFGRWQ